MIRKLIPIYFVGILGMPILNSIRINVMKQAFVFKQKYFIIVKIR